MATAQNPMFYRKVAPLSRDQHKGWYFDADQGFSFTEKSNSVYVAASEFAVAAREFPIVFARDANGTLVPAALLGLQSEQNLVLGDDGRWTANYLPAYIRRYPFLLATNEGQQDQFAVCIDESYSGFNTAKEGVPLIGDDGAQGEIVARTVEFLQEFHKHSLLTERFCKALDELDVIEPMQAQIELKTGDKLSLSGMFCVRREKLNELDADKLKELMANGALDLIFLHIHSLSNLDKLMQRLTDRMPAAAETAAS